MSEVGGTPRKTAHVGGDSGKPQPVQGESEKERVWRALVQRGASERQAAALAGVSRWKVRNLKQSWIAVGWLKERRGGGVEPTDKAPKELRPGWADTPQGSPLNRRLPYASSAGEPARLHRSKLKAALMRDVEPTDLAWWLGSKPSANRVVYHRFELPCQTSAGLLGVPLQVIQPARLDRPHTLIIQSANIMARESALVPLEEEEVLEWVRESMQGLVDSWLGDDAVKCSRLEWTGLDKEQMEVAYPALAGARVGGDPQRDYAAVDKSDRYSPWDKEEEQNLTAYLRLRKLEVTMGQVEGGMDRVAGLLERLSSATAEQIDGLAAAVEAISRRRS